MTLSFARKVIWVAKPVWVLDERRNRVATYPDDGPRTRVERCLVQPGATAETLGGRDTTAIRWTVHAPPGTSVEATDAVALTEGGDLYRVDGHPAEVPSPTGAVAHVVILLVEWR